MLDSDVAMLYQYTTKNINKAVKRNLERFPEDFCFQLTEMEFQDLRFQIGTLKKKANNGEVTRKYLPYVFTEQGISMLSGILKNEIAVKVSVNIMRAFVEMRKFLMENGQVFERLTKVEYKLLEHDKKFEELFNQFQLEENIKQRIFFEGQIYDAYSIIVDMIKKANKKILIIDNYIDDNVLKMLTKKKSNVEVTILTSDKSDIGVLDIKKFNKENIAIQKRVILYAINRLFGTTKGIEKIHIEDIIKLCNNNIGNKYLTPNKKTKIVIKNKKIYIETVK